MPRETNGRVGPVASFGMLAVVVAAISGVIYWQSQLVTSRPSLPAGEAAPPSDPAAVSARLWQDPLGTVRQRVGLPCREPGSAPIGTPALVLPVTLWGGDSFEDHENRLRSRYAVLAALDAAGYMPEDAVHVRFACLEEGWSIVPYEWLILNPLRSRAPAGSNRSLPSAPPARILVVWLSDQVLSGRPHQKLAGRPLRRLHYLLDKLREGLASQADVRLLGPSHSNGLREMMQELKDLGAEAHWKLEVHSSWATADYTLLGIDPSRLTPEAAKLVRRTIATDRDLAKKLVEELKCRRVDPGQHGIALVSEWDTWYGRALPLTFAAQTKVRGTDIRFEDALEEVKKTWPDNISRVYYLRGLDGLAPGPGPGEKPAPRQGDQRASRADQTRETSPMERPEGQSQLDYARRLAVELAETARARGRAIQAIGVLGSDLYDKLLLLQALRPRFPQALFFTTDLDARLLHPSENSWARNLLVASSFGLEVPDAEGTRPPYRSNYQTALHFATLHALGRFRTVQEEQAAKAAQVYEVGKTRAILLTGERDSDRWQRDRLLGLMAAAVLLFALWAVLRQIRTLHRRPWWQGLLPHALFLLVVLAFLCLVTQPGGQEPFDLFEGVSIWPSELLRLVAAFLALQLCIKTQRRLRENTRRLCQDLGLAEGLPAPAWGSRGWWRGFHSLFRSDWLSTTESRTVGNLWEQYQTGEKPSQRWTRVAVCSVLYFGFALALVRTFGLPGTPYRGEASWLADRLILGASVVLLVLLTFLVLDVTLLCERFVRGLVRELNREGFIQSLRELRTGQSGDGDKTRLHPLWRAIDLIAQRTEAVGTPVLYPFVVLLLMILSRSSYFDQWAWSPALIGIWSVNSIFTIVCALILRRTAENARQRVSLRLRQERMIARAADQDSQVKLLDLSVAEVERERRGAFAPLPEQPAVRALLLPLGGIGTAVTLEPLMNLF